jgi:hypothetical protein
MAEVTAKEALSIINTQQLDISKMGDVEKLKRALGKPHLSNEVLQKECIDAMARHTAATFLTMARQKGCDINDRASVAKFRGSIGESAIGVDEMQQMMQFASKNKLEPVDIGVKSGELPDAALEGVAGGLTLFGQTSLLQNLGTTALRTRFTSPTLWGDGVAHRYT